MPKRKKTRGTPGFRFIRIDRKRFVVSSTRMRHMILAAAKRALIRQIYEIEHQWCVYWNCRVEASGRLPRTISDAAYIFTLGSRRMQRHAAAIAGHCNSFGDQSAHSYL